MYSYSLAMIVICLQSIIYMLSTIDLIDDFIIFWIYYWYEIRN